MSQTVELDNFTGNVIAQVKLTADSISGAQSFKVNNSAKFTSGAPIVLGNLGSKTCELLTAGAPTDGTTLPTTAAASLPHNSDDQVSLLFGTSLQIFSAADQYGTGQQPDDSSFSFLETVPIDPTLASTVYTDSTSGARWYKYIFYNVTTQAKTNLADSEAMQAGQIHYISLQQIRDSAGFSDSPQITDARIARFRDAAEREVNGALAAIINLPLPQPTNPIVVQIVKNIAAGELMQDAYNTISPAIVAQGATKSSQARKGGGNYTSLTDLVERNVVLLDANYNDTTRDDAPGFAGYPDETANIFTGGTDERQQFSINEEY